MAQSIAPVQFTIGELTPAGGAAYQLMSCGPRKLAASDMSAATTAAVPNARFIALTYSIGLRRDTMEKGYGQGDPRIAAYAERVLAPEDAILAEVRERSIREGLPAIQVSGLDGRHLEVIARACGARRAVEIGTLGGYSGICLLRGMGTGGVLHTFELEPKNAEVARASFAKAGFASASHIHVGPALERLGDLANEPSFDLVFIDADKVSYPAYLNWAAQHLRLGGVVLGDNAFGWGGVADLPSNESRSPEQIASLREFNATLANGGRWKATLLPTAEGLAMGVKIR